MTADDYIRQARDHLATCEALCPLRFTPIGLLVFQHPYHSQTWLDLTAANIPMVCERAAQGWGVLSPWMVEHFGFGLEGKVA